MTAARPRVRPPPDSMREGAQDLWSRVHGHRNGHILHEPQESRRTCATLHAAREEVRGPALLLGLDGLEQLRYEAVTLDGMPHGQARVDMIVIATAPSLRYQVPGISQVTDDALHRTLGDSHFRCQVSHAHRRIIGNADQYVAMVREKGPVSVRA